MPVFVVVENSTNVHHDPNSGHCCSAISRFRHALLLTVVPPQCASLFFGNLICLRFYQSYSSQQTTPHTYLGHTIYRRCQVPLRCTTLWGNYSSSSTRTSLRAMAQPCGKPRASPREAAAVCSTHLLRPIIYTS